MGSYSNFRGSIEFSRALTRDEFRAVKATIGTDSYAQMLELDPYGLSVETRAKGYTWVDDIRFIVEALPADVTARGFIERAGAEDDPYDMERAYIVNGRSVQVVKARIVWDAPQGAEGA